MMTVIEEALVKELKGLCVSCRHAPECIYRKTSTKVIIQCEVFESATDHGNTPATRQPKGLCLNCSKNPFCHLPKGPSGVWHCEEYE